MSVLRLVVHSDALVLSEVPITATTHVPRIGERVTCTSQRSDVPRGEYEVINVTSHIDDLGVQFVTVDVQPGSRMITPAPAARASTQPEQMPVAAQRPRRALPSSASASPTRSLQLHASSSPESDRS
jgi:cell division septation protein DedD